MKIYNPENGVPLFSYYLTEITQFGDFELEQQERILFTSRSKQELVKLCESNNWDCPDCKNSSNHGWHTHHIKYRSV
jgi:hypothetical protein